MLIDWFTVVAQLLNFLALIWLLRRFLYRPVLKALDEREKKIAGELSHAAAVEAEAGRQRDAWQRKNEEFDKQLDELMHKAARDAETTKASLLDEARKEHEALQTRLRESLDRERSEREHEATSKIRKEVFALAGKVLAELADTTLEERMVGVFCRHLHAARQKEIEAMAEAMREQLARPVVRSSFELEPELRRQIEEAVRKLLSSDAPLTFETAEGIGAGIELCVDGRCLAWNLESALESLDAAIESRLQA
jgi:F-type H+-transporting ATPase subunit b